MKIVLVSNWHERCGNAQYARELLTELWKEWPETITATQPREVLDNMKDAKVVIVNWHPSRVSLSPHEVQGMQSLGMKVIVVLQNSFSGYYSAEVADPLRYANVVVAHQKMLGNIEITYIPCGIPIVENLPETDSSLKIGIAGFPYAWKRFDLVAQVASELGGKALLIAPSHDMGDTDSEISKILGTWPSSTEVVRNFLSVEEVIKRLATCTMNICWYQHKPPDDLSGQSGSVRMAVASGRPLIVSNHPKLTSIAAYKDEIYVQPEEANVSGTARDIWQRLQAKMPVKKPKKILEDMCWDRTGKMYVDLIKKVAA